MTAPLPPPDIATRRPKIVALPKGRPLHRFHTYGPNRFGPLFFDTTLSGRLNAPDGRYGVLYTAERRAGAFAESFLRKPGAQVLDSALMAIKAHAELRPRRHLFLAQLTGPGLAVLGATAEVTHGGLPYDVPQAWSSALHDHPKDLDGIAYRARHDDAEICYALFDRCAADIEVHAQTLDLDQDWFWDLTSRYSLGVSP